MDKSRAEIGLDYASKWFEYHANQRQDVFKIFLVVFAGLFSMAAFLIQYRIGVALMPVGLVAVLSGLIFYLLDKRSRKLIEIGEETYVHFWSGCGLELDTCPVVRAQSGGRFEIRYKHAYNTMFLAMAIFGAILVLFGLMDGIKSYVATT